jgi:hypothetical protein
MNNHFDIKKFNKYIDKSLNEHKLMGKKKIDDITEMLKEID